MECVANVEIHGIKTAGGLYIAGAQVIIDHPFVCFIDGGLVDRDDCKQCCPELF